MVYLLTAQQAVPFDWMSIINPPSSPLNELSNSSQSSSTLESSNTLSIPPKPSSADESAKDIIIQQAQNLPIEFNPPTTPINHHVRGLDIDTSTRGKIRTLRNSALWTYREISDHVKIPLSTIY